MMDPNDKLQAFEALMSEVSSALADMVVAIQAKTDGTNEISATLADLVAAIDSKSKGESLDSIAAAIKAIRIQAAPVTVNVSPTPIQNIVQPAVVQILERAQPGDYKMTVKYDNYSRVTEALISRVIK